jgi:putative spermidine/putrescine transport system permease protein
MTDAAIAAAPDKAAGWPHARGRRLAAALPYLQSLPLWLVMGVFLLIPIITIVAVSFWDDQEYALVPTFILDNYRDVLTSRVTWTTYLSTLRYAAIVWAATLAIGFTVAYFLSFHIRSTLWQMVLFQLCAIPFLTSNVIRMISWIPFLGRNGILNRTLMALGVTDHPLEFLLFSPFAVVLAFVHLYTLFMVVPIFNTMMRIERSLIEAARDLGASPWQGFRHVVLPLIAPSLIGVALFGFSLSYDEFARTIMAAGSDNTLPLEIFAMTTNVTTPVLYALGSLTTAFSLAIVVTVVLVVLAMRRRRAAHAP